jgi:dihydrofolate reductase
MGRKTWDSIPPKFRPLPGRTNVVVTRQAAWQGLKADGATSSALRAESLAHAMELCGDVPDAWVIGGAQLYAQALPLATSAVVTEIDLDVQGDAFAPAFGDDWHEAAREQHVAANGLRYSFVTMRR